MEPTSLFDLRLTIDLVIIAAICIFVIFVIFKQRNILLIALTPFLLFLAIDSYKAIYNVLGTSTTIIPEGTVAVISSFVDNRKEWIHVWYYDEKTSMPKAIKIPYSKKSDKEAEKSRSALRQGQNSFLSFKRNENNNQIMEHHRLRIEASEEKKVDNAPTTLVPAVPPPVVEAEIPVPLPATPAPEDYDMGP